MLENVEAIFHQQFYYNVAECSLPVYYARQVILYVFQGNVKTLPPKFVLTKMEPSFKYLYQFIFLLSR